MGITIEYSGGTTAESSVLDTVVSGPVEGVGRGTRLALHAVPIVFGLVVLASAVYFVRITRDSWFFSDEWAMARQVTRVQDIVDPYNGHLSITILGIYRGLLEVFGFTTHLPYTIAGIVSLVAVPVAMFLVARPRVGAPAAATMGLILLWFRHISLEPGGLNHSLSLLGAIVCAYGLAERGRRSDLVVASSLGFALASSGGGVAVAVAALLHSLCTRANRPRWLAVLLPSAAWFLWWVVLVPPDPEALQELRPGVLDLARDAVRHAAESFRFLALGNRVAGGVLLAIFLAYAVWQIRRGLVAASNVLAWTAGLLFWWFGIMWSRWFFIGDVPAFRYEWVSAGFIMLAILPSERLSPSDWASPSTRRGALAAAAGVLVVAALLVHSVRPDARDFARTHTFLGRQARGQAAVVLEPDAVPAGTTFGFNFVDLNAAEVRKLLTSYGAGFGPGNTDGLLVDVGPVTLSSAPNRRAPQACEDLGRPTRAPPDSRVELYARAGTADVRVRRFGRDWITVGRVQPGRQATLALKGYRSSVEWELVAGEGVCASIEPITPS
jgi:hypothetical protein